MEKNTLYVKESQVLSTGTTTVGVVGKDCVVLAADKRATAGNFIADKKVQKVIEVNDRIAITTAGTVSDIQLLAKLIRAELKLKSIRSGRDSTVREAANLLAELVYGNIRKYSTIPGITHFLLGGTDTSLSLYDIYPDGSVTQIDDFVSSGSGCVYAYGVLENSYKQGLSEPEAVDLAIRSVNAAMQRDTASGEGIDLFVIDKNGIRQQASRKVSKALV